MAETKAKTSKGSGFLRQVHMQWSLTVHEGHCKRAPEFGATLEERCKKWLELSKTFENGKKVDTFVFQLEIGLETKRLHIQGCLEFNTLTTARFIISRFGPCDLRTATDPNKLLSYVTKPQTRVGGFYAYPSRGAIMDRMKMFGYVWTERGYQLESSIKENESWGLVVLDPRTSKSFVTEFKL